MSCIAFSFKKRFTHDLLFVATRDSITVLCGNRIVAFFDEGTFTVARCGVENAFFESDFASFPIKIDAFFLDAVRVFGDVGEVTLGHVLNETFFQLVLIGVGTNDDL